MMDSTRGALYPKIVSIVNQEVFSLEVCTFSHSLRMGTGFQRFMGSFG